MCRSYWAFPRATSLATHIAPGFGSARAALEGGATGQLDRNLPSPAHREAEAGASQLCLSTLACRPLACASTGRLT